MTMTINVSAADRFAGPAEFSQRRLAIGFLNVAHGLDHFVMLIFPMVVIELQAFYGVSLFGGSFAPALYVLAAALFVLGVFAAIYHPVGTALVLENATHRGRTLAFNGVCGNLGISLAAAITAVLTAALDRKSV